MAKIVELPRLSDTMEEGVIAKWHIAEGDKVKRGQHIADVETDKATMEFESFDAGIVLRLIAAEGDVLPIGSPIAVLGKEGEDPDEALEGHGGGGGSSKSKAKKSKAKSEDEAAEDEDAEDEAEDGEESEDAEDEAEDGEESEDDERAKGNKGAKSKGAKGKGAKASKRDEADDGDGEDDDAPSKGASDRSSERIAASPVARRLAREHGIDLGQVEGSGPRGRIVKADVEAAAERGPEAATGGAGDAATSDEADARGRPFVVRSDEPMRLSQMRKAIARRMSQANAEIPHFYLTTVVDMDAAVALREQLKQALPAKVSFNDLVLLAATRALVEHPAVNAYWDGETIVRRGNVHMGMAVAIDEGLIVPVIRFAEQKTLREFAEQSRDLGLRARDKKLAVAEMTGSTFTVSNLGMFGIDQFAAVINPGEGAILAVGAIADEAVARDGAIVVGKRMKMTLACDHRVMDGATGAKFLATMRGLLEQPLSMLA